MLGKFNAGTMYFITM